MHSIISGQFWVKSRSQHAALSNGNGMLHPRDFNAGENFYLRPMRFHPRRPDEYSPNWRTRNGFKI
jgi:hypothetical protein